MTSHTSGETGNSGLAAAADNNNTKKKESNSSSSVEDVSELIQRYMMTNEAMYAISAIPLNTVYAVGPAFLFRQKNASVSAIGYMMAAGEGIGVPLMKVAECMEGGFVFQRPNDLYFIVGSMAVSLLLIPLWPDRLWYASGICLMIVLALTNTSMPVIAESIHRLAVMVDRKPNQIFARANMFRRLGGGILGLCAPLLYNAIPTLPFYLIGGLALAFLVYYVATDKKITKIHRKLRIHDNMEPASNSGNGEYDEATAADADTATVAVTAEQQQLPGSTTTVKRGSVFTSWLPGSTTTTEVFGSNVKRGSVIASSVNKVQKKVQKGRALRQSDMGKDYSIISRLKSHKMRVKNKKAAAASEQEGVKGVDGDDAPPQKRTVFGITLRQLSSLASLRWGSGGGGHDNNEEGRQEDEDDFNASGIIRAPSSLRSQGTSTLRSQETSTLRSIVEEEEADPSALATTTIMGGGVYTADVSLRSDDFRDTSSECKLDVIEEGSNTEELLEQSLKWDEILGESSERRDGEADEESKEVSLTLSTLMGSGTQMVVDHDIHNTAPGNPPNTRTSTRSSRLDIVLDKYSYFLVVYAFPFFDMCIIVFPFPFLSIAITDGMLVSLVVFGYQMGRAVSQMIQVWRCDTIVNYVLNGVPLLAYAAVCVYTELRPDGNKWWIPLLFTSLAETMPVQQLYLLRLFKTITITETSETDKSGNTDNDATDGDDDDDSALRAAVKASYTSTGLGSISSFLVASQVYARLGMRGIAYTGLGIIAAKIMAIAQIDLLHARKKRKARMALSHVNDTEYLDASSFGVSNTHAASEFFESRFGMSLAEMHMEVLNHESLGVVMQ